MVSPGTDLYGFTPFPGPQRKPGPDCFPGPLSAWRPSVTVLQEAYSYATQVFFATGDRSIMDYMAENGIGDK